MPEHKTSKEHRTFAKRQRHEMTRAEALLWQAIRGNRFNGWRFKRQVPYGPYVADFSCAQARLVVELDGRPHQDEEQMIRDGRRDAWFQERGFRVLRISNDLVLGSIELALKEIELALTAPSPGLLRRPPSPSRGEGKRTP
jgi:very-short-patch-repair endonuclease